MFRFKKEMKQTETSRVLLTDVSFDLWTCLKYHTDVLKDVSHVD